MTDFTPRKVRSELTQDQADAIIKLIVREQGLISTYGDPARFNHSDMQFFNILEARLIQDLADAKLADEGERKSREQSR